ncbi:helix-turn-helix domain-containing protein [Streptomyces sp. NPDC001508]|uniref:winged helix-turn-helix transcriptional regulator n=1 Tax=Streptomyces sp. NPDC001508 TaxID=3154656 RepID=UPI003331884B
MAAIGLPPAVDADVTRVTEALNMITPRWRVRILLALKGSPQRYTQVADKLSYLPSGQLHPKIRSLCDVGLAERTEYSARHVTYSLTRRGRQLLPVIPVIAAWAGEHLERPEQPPSAIEQVEDSLALLTGRQVPAILWLLKFRQEASARVLGRFVLPDANWTGVYPPLRQLIDDGLVETAGKGQPYRLSPSGEALGTVFGVLSMWAAGRPLDHAFGHPLWGQVQPGVTRKNRSRLIRQALLPAPPRRRVPGSEIRSGRPTQQAQGAPPRSIPARTVVARTATSGIR